MTDLRIPIGLFFAILGVLLLSVSSARASLTNVPVNLYAGIAMLIFAAVMLLLAVRGSRGKAS